MAVCGGGGVGKSCLTIQFVQNQFVETWDPTIEDSYQKQIKVDKDIVMLDILDTAGQEEYKALRDEYMRSADGFLVVYDVANKKTFGELAEFRKQIQRAKDTPFPCMVIVGNKCDLPPEDRQVTEADAQDLSKEWKIPYLEASAKLRKNVDESFEEVVKMMIRSMRAAQAAENGETLETNKPGKKKGKKGDKDCVIS